MSKLLHTRNNNNNMFSLFDAFLNRDFFSGFFGDTMSSMGNYSVEKVSNTNYAINLNVAGFFKDELEISHDGDTLYINGEKKDMKNDNYIYNGFSENLHYSFSLSHGSEIVGAEFLNNGILRIEIKEKKNIENRAKKIFIR